MSTGLILAIDQGTTNTKALLVDRSGLPVFRTSSPVGIVTTQDGFVEQDPMELWNSVLTVSAAAAQYAATTGAKIEAVGISNQRETAVAWDASTGEPLTKAISWQCGRSAGICERISGQADRFRTKTGLPLAPLVSAGKWTWLLENVPAVQARTNSTLRLGTVDSWLLQRMTCGAVHSTDLTNASRTGLLNLRELRWDRDLLDIFGIPLSALPEAQPSAGYKGTCHALPGLPDVPILAMLGDSHAAMFGHGSFAPGSVKATYGTGSSVMALTPNLMEDAPSLARAIAWSTSQGTQFALEGNIPMTGSAIQWLGEFLGQSNPSSAVAHLGSTVEIADGVYFVPAMLGLGAPHWDPSARGAILGLRRHHTSAHVARAALDSIAYQVADVFFAVESTAGIRCEQLLVDGGATRNSALLQFQADILGRPVLRSRNEELSAIGAAWMAGMELGWWKSFPDLESIPHDVDRFDPVLPEMQRGRLYQGWKSAIHAVRTSTRCSA
jgi:glycerol kinase